jgi:hypothetical protein
METIFRLSNLFLVLKDSIYLGDHALVHLDTTNKGPVSMLRYVGLNDQIIDRPMYSKRGQFAPAQPLTA